MTSADLVDSLSFVRNKFDRTHSQHRVNCSN
jgi:hypothetical protein